MEKLVSAIIPTYNRTYHMLERAIKSIRNQTYPYIEIIVVNDNSVGTEFYTSIKNYCLQYPDIIYIESNNSGACHARNLGSACAQGHYLAFLDDDDIWLPDKITIQLKCFKPDIGLVFSNGFWVYTDKIPPVKKEYRKPENFHEEVTFNDLLHQNLIGTTSQIMVSRECFWGCGKFDEQFIARHDYDFCLRVSKKYKIIGSPLFLFEHYYHSGDQIIKSSQKSLIGYRLLYEKYKQDYDKRPIAKSNICYKIARVAYNEKNYAIWMKFLILSVINNPSHAKEIWCKTLDGKTF